MKERGVAQSFGVGRVQKRGRSDRKEQLKHYSDKVPLRKFYGFFQPTIYLMIKTVLLGLCQ